MVKILSIALILYVRDGLLIMLCICMLHLSMVKLINLYITVSWWLRSAYGSGHDRNGEDMSQFRLQLFILYHVHGHPWVDVSTFGYHEPPRDYYDTIGRLVEQERLQS